MQKKIIIVHKACFHNRPPVISVTTILNDLGYDVSVITVGINDYWKQVFSKRNINYYTIPDCKWKFIGKVISYLNFRYRAMKILDQNNFDLLWVESAYTIVSLGNCIKKYKYVLQLQELYEKSKMQLRAIGNVIHDAQIVFMPEYNRTILYKLWFSLKKDAVVLPNKPYFLPDVETIKSISLKYSDLLNSLQGKKVVLYQGLIDKNRDLTSYIKAVDILGDPFVLLLVGNDYGVLDKYLSMSNRVIHIEHLPAPDYLVFTELAHIGIVSYTPNSINNVYCAPNKIFEYSCYGLPMIANNIPGLKYTVEYADAGICVNENEVEEIVAAIKLIDTNHERYSQAAVSFFEGVDNKKTIEKALRAVFDK